MTSKGEDGQHSGRRALQAGAGQNPRMFLKTKGGQRWLSPLFCSCRLCPLAELQSLCLRGGKPPFSMPLGS